MAWMPRASQSRASAGKDSVVNDNASMLTLKVWAASEAGASS
jgi:hypothetical protein